MVSKDSMLFEFHTTLRLATESKFKSTPSATLRKQRIIFSHILALAAG